MLYELTCLINPDLNEEQVAGFVQKLESQLAEAGKVQTKESPKKITLAYPIKKQGSAFLFSIIFEASAENTGTLTTQLEKDSEIMRFLLIKTKPKAEKTLVPAGPKKGKAEKERPDSPIPAKEARPKPAAAPLPRRRDKEEEKPFGEKTKEEVKKVEMEKIETELNKILNESQ